MFKNAKEVDSLQVTDLMAHPVWRYESGTAVVPVARLPVTSLAGKVVGVQVVLANGEKIWALVGNVDTSNARMTEHFLTLSVEREGRWFTLSRYHDFDYDKNGPEALARFLGLDVGEVFPISYDIRPYARGEAAALSGSIDREPRERLSRAEIIAMAVPPRQG